MTPPLRCEVVEHGAGRLARAPSRLLYLHGFRSGPGSFKARRMAQWQAAHRPGLEFVCPQLPPAPAAAIALAESLLAQPAADADSGVHRDGGWALVGSSLGGFYASVLAERHGLPAVLLNPAVDPARDLQAHLGEQAGYHDPALRFTFTHADIDALAAMAPARLTRPERYAAVIATGDELLDWREMAAKLAGARLRIVQGGDHALSDFDHHLPFILDFLHLQQA